MAKPLDGPAFQAYCRRLGFRQQTQELLATIRFSPPSRTPGSRNGNMAIWYPSKKMQCIIKAESHKVEFAFLLEAEHSDDVLEFFDQPPSIPLEYPDKRGRIQRPQHTADYFVFCYDSAGWEECKPVEKLLQFAQQGSKRYVLDKHNQWRCPPGEAFAAQYGLTYRVRASDQINWATQDNWLYIEDYYQALEKLAMPDRDLEILRQIVDEHPGMSLADLRSAASGVSSDRINIAIAKHALYVDLTIHRLTEPERTPVFRDRYMARACSYCCSTGNDSAITTHPVVIEQGNDVIWDGQTWRVANVGDTEITLVSVRNEPLPLLRSTFEAWVKEGKIVGGPSKTCGSITPEGKALLDQADDVALATAVFRNRVINPDQYDDDEQQQQTAIRAVAVSERTKFRWKHRYRDAENRYGSGFLGLLPRYHNCGGTKRLDPQSRELIEEVLQTYYDTVTRKPKRGAFGEYLKRCEEQNIPSTTQRTFYAEVQRHKTTHDQVLVREGARAAYPFKDYVHSNEKTISRHGDYAWAMAHIDHTELDLVLCDSKTNQLIGKCWLTLMILSAPRRIAAYYLTFDPPSYRSCMMVRAPCRRVLHSFLRKEGLERIPLGHGTYLASKDKGDSSMSRTYQ